MASYMVDNYTLIIEGSICTIIVGVAAISTADNVNVITFQTEQQMLLHIQTNNLTINNPNWNEEEAEWLPQP